MPPSLHARVAVAIGRLVLILALSLCTAVATAQDRPASPAPPAQRPPAGAPAAGAGTGTAPAVENGSTVRIDYTLKDAAGAVLDSTKDREPLRYVHGQQEILPGLERALEGLRAGAEKRVTLTPEEAYGFVNPEAQAEVPREMVPAGAAVVGTRLTARNPAGAARQVMVKEIREKTIILDLNHPLAGKTIVFEVKVIEVQPPGATPPVDGPPAGTPADAPPARR